MYIFIYIYISIYLYLFCLSHHVDVFQWDRECFIIWFVNILSRFFTMSVDEISTHGSRIFDVTFFVTFFDSVHTRSVSHAHFLWTFPLRDVQTRTRMTQGVRSAHGTSHPLPVPARPLRHLIPVYFFLAELFPIRKRGSSALPERAARSLASWSIPRTPQVNVSKESDKVISVDDDTTSINNPNHNNISDFSKITRDNTEQEGVPSMFETSVSHVSHGEFALQSGRSPRKHASGNRCWTEREEREGSVISVAESMSRESRRNSLRIHSFQTHKELYSDERDLRKVLERRAQQAVYGQNSAPRKFLLDRVRPGDPELGAKNLDYALIESGRELESQRRQWPEVNQWTDQAQRERYTYVVNWSWRTVFTRNAMQDVAKKFEESRRPLYVEQNGVTRQTLNEYSVQQDQESRTVSFFRGSSKVISWTIGIYWRLENLPRSWLTEQFWQCPRFNSSSYSFELQKA